MSPHIMIFDSGLGGLSVFNEVIKSLPEASYAYLADNAAFPYGDWEDEPLVERILAVVGAGIAACKPDLVIVACNTASTIALEGLRSSFDVPFVGVVPAIKVAAEQTESDIFTVLATPGTVKRDYTKNLIAEFAGDKQVHLVGSPDLAKLAEDKMRGLPVDMKKLSAILWPCLNATKNGRTDIIVLACTHFPLLLEEMNEIVPWPVRFIDPAPSIARRTLELLSDAKDETVQSETNPPANRINFTGKLGEETQLRTYLAQNGFPEIEEKFFELI